MWNPDHLILTSNRLRLEPVQENHASTLQRLFWDADLYRFIPEDPPTEAELKLRCEKWAKRESADGQEGWLNWIAYSLDTEEPVGHFQATVKPDQTTQVAYLVPRIHQRKGYALEGLQSVFHYLKGFTDTKIVRAFIDDRNIASLKLVEKLGMSRETFLPDADYFKGSTSNEWMYQMIIRG